jgi:hypothetical protein
VVAQGGTLQVDDPTQTWQPGQPVTGKAFSDPVSLGSLNADSTGSVKGSFTLPLSLQPGAHTLELSGLGKNGVALSKTASFTVTQPNSSTPSGGGSAAGATASPTSNRSSGPLALTGGRFGLFWFGVTALAGGLLLVYSARRRRNPFGL